MASRALSRSIISSARSALHSSGRNTVSVRAASAGGGGTGSSATARPPSSSGTTRNYLFRNDTASSRRRLAESTIPLHNAVANAKLKSHLAINSSPCSAISLGLQGFFGTHWSSLMIYRFSWLMNICWGLIGLKHVSTLLDDVFQHSLVGRLSNRLISSMF